MTTMTATGFTLKGRHVLAMLLLFFGTVFGVNFYMARVAIQTFSGLEAEKPYQSGLKYNEVIAAAREQAERNWKVEATVLSQADGVLLTVTQRDGAGVVTPGLAMRATFMHPADRRRDVSVALTPAGDGRFSASAPVAAGRWDLQIEAQKEDALLFRSVNRTDVGAVK
jgi:nitrogen fixation protein FixH